VPIAEPLCSPVIKSPFSDYAESCGLLRATEPTTIGTSLFVLRGDVHGQLAGWLAVKVA